MWQHAPLPPTTAGTASAYCCQAVLTATAIATAGIANVMLGCVLIHDLKGQPWIRWLLPAAVTAGSLGILALLLEAFKRQVCGGGADDDGNNMMALFCHLVFYSQVGCVQQGATHGGQEGCNS